MKRLRESLDKEKKEHAAHVSELERRNIAEKNRLKKEMLRKVKETKRSLLAMTEDQLHTTTKRTILENEQLTTELHYQSKVTEKLIKQNNEVLVQNRALRRQIELHEETERMLATRTNFLQKLVKKLNDKMKDEEDNQNKVVNRFGNREHDMIEELELRGNHIHELEVKIQDMEIALKETKAQSEYRLLQLDKTKQQISQLLTLQDEAVTFILTCMQEAKREVLNRKNRQEDDDDDDDEEEEEKNREDEHQNSDNNNNNNNNNNNESKTKDQINVSSGDSGEERILKQRLKPIQLVSGNENDSAIVMLDSNSSTTTTNNNNNNSINADPTNKPPQKSRKSVVSSQQEQLQKQKQKLLLTSNVDLEQAIETEEGRQEVLAIMFEKLQTYHSAQQVTFN